MATDGNGKQNHHCCCLSCDWQKHSIDLKSPPLTRHLAQQLKAFVALTEDQGSFLSIHMAALNQQQLKAQGICCLILSHMDTRNIHGAHTHVRANTCVHEVIK